MADMEDKDEFDEFGSVALMDYELSQVPVDLCNNDDEGTGNGNSVIDKLHEQLCTMEGENKYLRSKNEKMDYQIRKIEDEKRKCLALHEQQSTKQQEALKADIVFKDKEIMDLTQRYKVLEDRYNQQLASNTENGIIGNPRPLTCSNRINIDANSRPLRKRARPISLDTNELEQESGKDSKEQVQSTGIVPVEPTVRTVLTVDVHSNAILASEGGVNLVKHLIKDRVMDQMINDSGHAKRDEGTASDRILNESISLESVLSDTSFDLFANNWTSPATKHQPHISSYSDTSYIPGFDSSVHILNSALAMHTDSFLCPHSSTNPSPCILQSLIESFDTDISFLNFIESCLLRYYAFMDSQSLASTRTTNNAKQEDTGSASSGPSNWRFSSELSSCHPLSTMCTQLTPLSSDDYSSLGSVSTEYTASSTCSQSIELNASLPNINIELVFTILSSLAKHNHKARQDILHAKPLEELVQTNGTSSDEMLTERKMQFTESYIPCMKSLSKHMSFNNKIPTHVGSTISSSYSGNIFDLLLQCLNVVATIGRSTHSKEKEILISILETLVSLSEDCDMQLLEKFSILLKKEYNSLEHLLQRDDTSIALHVLALLTSISRSPSVVSMLCSNSRSCVLGNCYTLFCKPPSTRDHRDTVRIWDQLIRFISHALSTDSGRRVLLESSCGCSLNLTKYLLECMMNIVHTLDKLRTTKVEANSSTLSNYLLTAMLNVLQMVIHNRKQVEELKLDIVNKRTCLYVVNTCFSWERNRPSEEILQDIYQSIVAADSIHTGTNPPAT